jgi:hypothetical protein
VNGPKKPDLVLLPAADTDLNNEHALAGGINRTLKPGVVSHHRKYSFSRGFAASRVRLACQREHPMFRKQPEVS